ncbi:MAG: ABC transporter ATP-binding protein [Rhodospirillales bacterium]|nr:ABC transporter ATP-binding protein [Rhodospirillales bacterium]
MSEPSHVLLSINDLSVRFATAAGTADAVASLSFAIEEGETLAIVGESGSGKSVSALAIMGLVPNPPGRVTSGQIVFRRRNGSTEDLLRASSARLRDIRGNEIAMVFQEPLAALSPVFTIGEQIAESLRLHQRKSHADAMRMAVRMLGSLGISEPEMRARSYPHQISGGMAQRVMIAMAMACRPRLLIADEPTTALDVTIQAEILSLIRQMKEETGMAVLFITHNLGVVAQIADRVAVMYAGRLVEEGPTKQIFSSPRMPYTSGLLASVPRLVTDDSPLVLSAIPGEPPSPLAHPRGCAFHPRCRYAVKGLCDTTPPPLRDLGNGQAARCLRIDEIVGGAT